MNAGHASNKLSKIAAMCGTLVRRPQEIKRGLLKTYYDVAVAYGPITSVSSRDLLGENISVALGNFLSVDGNVNLDELAFMCALARKNQPHIVLEIGTFDGNTALQLALNTPPETKIFTLDLPTGAEGRAENDPVDAKYIASSRRVRRRYLGSPVEHKIIQCYGNSLTHDFAEFTVNGRPQFIFIDAGHSYKCVRNDSEKALAILDPEGVIAWHDYSAEWPGVFQYLVELSRRIPLVHVGGTSLVIYCSPGATV
jgi:predicted O-methyltransferase YrrM